MIYDNVALKDVDWSVNGRSITWFWDTYGMDISMNNGRIQRVQIAQSRCDRNTLMIKSQLSLDILTNRTPTMRMVATDLAIGSSVFKYLNE